MRWDLDTKGNVLFTQVLLKAEAPKGIKCALVPNPPTYPGGETHKFATLGTCDESLAFRFFLGLHHSLPTREPIGMVAQNVVSCSHEGFPLAGKHHQIGALSPILPGDPRLGNFSEGFQHGHTPSLLGTLFPMVAQGDQPVMGG